MKWMILMVALLGDLMIVAAFAYLFYAIPESTHTLIFLSIIAYILWRKMGGFSNWKLSTVKSFLRNWDRIRG